MTKFKELTVPHDFEDVEFAKEVLRVFIGEGDSFVVLDSGAFPGKLKLWGAVLADIAGHVATMIGQSDDLVMGSITKEDIYHEIETGYSQRMAAKMDHNGRILGARH